MKKNCENRTRALARAKEKCPPKLGNASNPENLADMKAQPSRKNRYLYLGGALAVIIAVVCICCGCSGQTDLPAETTPAETAAASAGMPDTVPVVTLEGDCLKDYTNWNDKSTYYPATLTYDDGVRTFTMDIQIKPQGTSSLTAPKKNFTIKFDEGVCVVDKWGEQKKYVLKADYIDPTRSGNVVSAKLAAEMNAKYGVLTDTPNNGVIDGFPIWVKINGEDAGIFNWTIPKDAWLLNMDEDNPNHLLLACEGSEAASALWTSEIDYEKDWSFEVGEATEESTAAFERMAAFVSTSDDETFVRDFDQYLDLDACLNYICFINASQAYDNFAKNMLMATYDGKVWYPILYDLDSLWGIGVDGTSVAELNPEWGGYLFFNNNCLLYRVNLLFGDQVRERYQQLREGILSKEHIIESFEAYMGRIPQEYYDIDHAMWNADGSRIRTVELMSQLMDEYLPAADEALLNNAAAAPSTGISSGNQSAASGDAMVHYVWETDGVQQSLDDPDTLPIAATFRYTLDGKAISARELAGKSGCLEMTLKAERKAAADAVYGIAAVVQLENARYGSCTVTGGTLSKSQDGTAEVCTGSGWLTPADSVYEMRLTMEVTDFDPAKYVVVIHPVYFADGDGDDVSLQALLSTAGELTAIIDDGIELHTSMTEWHTYLTNLQNSLTETAAAAEALVPAEGTETADSIMARLLAAAEAEADALLQSLEYPVTANMTAEARRKLLTQAAADPDLSETETAQASALTERLDDCLLVTDQLQKTQQSAAEIRDALETISATMPDLVGAYSYGNDSLYGILYRISTLYQNIANFYSSQGGGSDWLGSGEWQDVIIFTNHENLLP